MKPHTLTELREGWELSQPSQRRAMLIDGAMFAGLTIRTQTETAERDFTLWVTAGRPRKLSTVLSGHLITARQKRLDSLLALTVEDVDTLGQIPTRQREQLFANLTWGYGAAKACFALACGGLGREGCIDGLLATKHTDLLTPLGWSGPKAPSAVERKTNLGWQTYWAAVDTLWSTPDTAAAQWSEWLADRADQNRTISHGLLTTLRRNR